MKIIILALLAMSCLALNQVEQDYYYLVIQPRDCLKKNCQTQLTVMKDDYDYKACAQSCKGQDSKCFVTCLPKDNLSPLKNTMKCSEKNKCTLNEKYLIEGLLVDAEWCLAITELYLFNLSNTYKLVQNKLQECSNNCKGDELCYDRCQKNDVVKAALAFYKAADGNCFPYYLNDIYCFKEKCPQDLHSIKDANELMKANKCYILCKNEKACWDSCFPIKNQPLYIESATCAKKNNCTQLYNPATQQFLNSLANIFEWY